MEIGSSTSGRASSTMSSSPRRSGAKLSRCTMVVAPFLTTVVSSTLGAAGARTSGRGSSSDRQLPISRRCSGTAWRP